MPNCVFCRMISAEVKEPILFEDGEVYAFLDAHPLARGHTVVLPRRHVALLEELDSGEMERLFRVVHALIPAIRKAVDAPASTIAVNNGKESGQQIPHAHVHIIPRNTGDAGSSIHELMRGRPNVSREEMSSIAKGIASSLRKG